MAVHEDMVYEFRATGGAAANSGGFRSGGTGTDRSQQDAAHATYTDIVIDGADDTKITSAADNFAADDVHNLINITSGTGFTTGRYEITAVAAGVATLDRAVGTLSSTGGNATLGGAIDIWTDAIFDDANGVLAGNKLHVKNDGTANLSIFSVGKDGTLLKYITVEGYNTTRGDNPVGANRPAIAMGGNAFSIDNRWIFSNFIFTTSHASGVQIGANSKIVNCKSTNASASANRDAFKLESLGGIFRSEAISTNGEAITFNLHDIKVVGCYIHDSLTGINVGGTDSHVIYGCIFDTCTNGVKVTSGSDGSAVIGNTFYNCTTQIDAGATNDSWTIVNNIFDAGTDGVKWGDADQSMFMDFNCWDNTTDVTNVVKGDNAVTGDPGLTDPANGDFTLGSGSNCLDAGLQVGTDQGVVGNYKVNIGTDQDDVAAPFFNRRSDSLLTR